MAGTETSPKFLISIISHSFVMHKKFLRNSPLYLLTLLNLVYALKHGFSWLTYVSFALTGCVLVLDVSDVIKNRKR